jgi:MFS family permease
VPLTRLSFAGLIVMGLGCGFVGPNIYVFAQTLAGPSVAGKWTGLQNCLGNLAGVIVGPLTGWIVDRTGHFGSAFGICSAVAACGIVSWVLLVDRLEETTWQAKPEHIQVVRQVA